MAKRYRLSSIAIEGFRGINRKAKIDLSADASIVFGPNGVGKSSIMQSIEWGLFGGLISAVLGPAEFKKEDAIVNSFNPQKKASVTIVLVDEKGKKVEVTRERKLGRSSTSGKAELRVETEEAKYSGEEAQLELNKLLRMTATEFYASTYLHQEAVRDLIVGDPLLRSEVIDKLLGLHFIRELIDFIPLKFVAKESKTVAEEIKDIKERKMQEVVISKKKLGELETEIENFGIPGKDFAITSLWKRSQEVSDEIMSIGKKMKTKTEKLEKPSQELSSLDKTLGQLKKTLDEIERAWSTVYKESVNETSSFRNIKQKYEEAMGEVAALGSQDAAELSKKKTEILDQISKMEKTLEQRSSSKDFLQQHNIVAQRLESNLEASESSLESIKKDYGDESVIRESLEGLKQRIDEETEKIKTEEAFASLLVSGLDYLKASSPKKCPLCKNDIACPDLTLVLEKEINQKESAKIIRGFQKAREQARQEESKAEKALASFLRFQSETAATRSQISKEQQELEQNGFKPTGNLMKYIDNALSKLNSEISDIDEKMRGLKSEVAQLNVRIQDVQRKADKLNSVEKEAQGTTGTKKTGAELIDEISRQIDDSDQNTRLLETVTADFRTSKNHLEDCARILGYLKEKNKVDELERGLPALKKRVDDLEDKLSKIKELETGLTDIHHATSTAREEMVKKALSDLQSTVGAYYSKILCHPYYVNLQLIPEEERGKAIYRIMAWDKDFKQGTYVQTRFSNAQMNAVALALFMSMSTRLQSNLDLIILDDPSQSMDNAHKDALSKLLGEVSSQKQILVATQDRDFKEFMQKSANRPKTKVHEFARWDTDGPEIDS